MTCRDCITFLADYVSGDLPSHRRETFEGHLTLCPNCRVFVTQYRETIVVSRAAMAGPDAEPVPALPPELIDAIRKALDES